MTCGQRTSNDDPVGETSHQAVTPEVFRGIFRQTVSTVAVVTAGATTPVGFTATSVTSASVDPPMVALGVSHTSRSWSTIDATEHLGVHFLRADQDACARRFAANGADKFGAGLGWHWGPHRIPVLDDCLSSLLCQIAGRLRVSESNTLIVARVLAARIGSHAPPLTYRDGRYNG